MMRTKIIKVPASIVKQKDIYPNVRLKKSKVFSDIGKVHKGKISNGDEMIDYSYIELEKPVKHEDLDLIEYLHLAEVNGKYYIDKVHGITRLNKQLIEKHNLSTYFTIDREEKTNEDAK